ncbi:hypothetical protein LCGC14_3169440, partial [marine sediment metagenome]
NQMTARGDNCDGLVEVEYRTKLNDENADDGSQTAEDHGNG